MFSTECPNCREPIPVWRTLLRTAWGRFQCPACGSVLGVDTKRRLLTAIPWAALVMFTVAYVRIMSKGYLAGIALLAFLAYVLYGFRERLVVYERRSFCCRDCGYALSGLTETRCPECGRPFDPDERLAMEARIAEDAAPANRRGDYLLIALAIALTLSLLVGLWVGQSKAPPLVPAASPVAPVGTPQAP